MSESIMKVKVSLFEDVQNNEGDKHVDDHVRQVEHVKEHERPYFEHRLYSQKQRKISKLYYPVKMSLIVLETLALIRETFCFFIFPQLIRNIDNIKNQLQNNESSRLLSYHKEFCCRFDLVRNRKENDRNDDVEDQMEHH